MISLLLAATLAAAPDLRLDYTRESLVKTVRHYRQYIDGREVAGGERIEETRDGVTRVVYEHLAADRGGHDRAHVLSLCDECVYVNVRGEARLARRAVIATQPLEPHAIYTDAATGEVLRDDPLFFKLTANARVFDVNPVTKLNDPTLRDHADAASAVPDAAYTNVELTDLDPATPLSGPNAKIVDTQAPFTAHADPTQSLIFDRSQPQFEEVNAYFQIDRTQRYLQSLGYIGARRLVDYAIPIDPHGTTSDNSFYVQQAPAGHGELFFGDGGTDDAEDADIMLHEFFHAVQDWIAPGALAGPSNSQARAISEGSADYWSFSSNYAGSVASGRDPYCIADWDARCGGDDPSQQCGYADGADCLRRVDSTRTMAGYNNSNQAGSEYDNAAIWSSALREIFLKIGKQKTDTLEIESFFGVPPLATFKLLTQKMIEADALLNRGANAATICSAMTSRGILDASDCFTTPRGEWTYFTAGDTNVVIPDAGAPIESTILISDTRAIDRVAVRVDIDHPVRGDLVITLIAPNGVEVPLKTTLDVDRTPGIHATFGLDAPSASSLDVLHGISAAGTWTLRVQDVFPGDAGSLQHWNLVLRFAGDQPLAERPSDLVRQTVPVVAHIVGAAGVTWTSDVRLFNRSNATKTATLIFTPSGHDGTTDFAALKFSVDARQVVAIDDVVAQMQMIGSGQLEIDGDVVVTTRINGGGAHEYVPAIRSTDPTLIAVIPIVENDAAFRTNIGIAETSGHAGRIRIEVGDASQVVDVAPFSHIQIPLTIDTPRTFAMFGVENGGAKIDVYASLIDKQTNQTSFVPMRPKVTSEPEYAPVIGAGAWRTEVVLPISNVFMMFSGQLSRRSPSMTDDVVRDVFGTEGIGVLTVNVNGVAGRIVFDVPGGSVAEYLPFVSQWPASGDLLHVENSDRFRTNIAIANPNQNARAFTVTDYDSAGRLLRTQTIGVRFEEVVLVPLETAASRVHVDGGALVYASVIDRATGDPMLVPLQ
jgi:subtilisin-like proprotein convertase family protein